MVCNTSGSIGVCRLGGYSGSLIAAVSFREVQSDTMEAALNPDSCLHTMHISIRGDHDSQYSSEARKSLKLLV